jgi:hypothetical protein
MNKTTECGTGGDGGAGHKKMSEFLERMATHIVIGNFKGDSSNLFIWRFLKLLGDEL